MQAAQEKRKTRGELAMTVPDIVLLENEPAFSQDLRGLAAFVLAEPGCAREAPVSRPAPGAEGASRSDATEVPWTS